MHASQRDTDGVKLPLFGNSDTTRYGFSGVFKDSVCKCVKESPNAVRVENFLLSDIALVFFVFEINPENKTMTQIPIFFSVEDGKYQTRLSKDSGEVKKKYVQDKLTKVQNLNPVESLIKIFRKLLE